ncbi:uncharacterized protein LOC123566299 [Mercenaria mercenaria]|uniref:uncharacterized protein LOC123566299 n=1 Tax=Mercenaria mercenaria TaxID=6596 RepID=UPI00234EACA1|nr:uncharacterized protein LOC123566299 [Mercenaria mercenaria]
MACRKNKMKYYKFNDFWDTLRKDLDAIEQKAKEDEEEKKSRRKGSQRVRWTEDMEIACHKKRIIRERKLANAELKMTAKALLAIRREALRLLLEEESKMYEEEMRALEITF